MNRTIHMRLGGEIKHRTGLVFGQQLRHQIRIADVAMDKDMLKVVSQCTQCVEIAGIGEFV